MRWGAGGQRGRRIRCEVRTAGCSELGPPPPAGALGGGGCSLPAVPAPPASLSSGVHPPPATPLPARSLWPLASPFPARCRGAPCAALRHRGGSPKFSGQSPRAQLPPCLQLISLGYFKFPAFSLHLC